MNTNNIVKLWRVVRGSYWFVPALLALAAVGLSFLLPFLDDVLVGTGEDVPEWIYGGGADGARSLLSAIAGSMITVASLTFSVTLVALSSAAQQYGPRLLNNFMRDRGYQIVLGTFVANFLYSILVLRQIKDFEDELVVPRLSVSFAVLLAIAALALLIYFFHHAASSLRAEGVIGAVARDLTQAIERDRKRHQKGDTEADWRAGESEESYPDGALQIDVPDSGYLQAINEGRLRRIAAEEDLMVRSKHRVGDFLLEGTTMVEVWPPERITDKVEERIRDCFSTGASQYVPGDIEAAIHELVEIAVRALSPSLNDPNTAVAVVDQLTLALERMASMENNDGFSYHHVDGHLRLLTARLRFVDAVDLAFDKIRHHGRGIPTVSLRMLQTIASLATQVEDVGSRAALLRQATMIERTSEAVPEPADRRKITRLYALIEDRFEVDAIRQGGGE